MCGISGFISEKSFIKKNSINSTLDLMGRRGPDAKNYYIEDNSSKSSSTEDSILKQIQSK